MSARRSLTTRLGQVNVRSGPGTGFEALRALDADVTVQVDGWAQDSERFTWWHLVDGGWVRSDLFDGIPDPCYDLPPVVP